MDSALIIPPSSIIADPTMPEQSDQFEAALDGFPFAADGGQQVARDPLEFLLSEFIERQRRGEEPSVERYARRYPELAEQILELFPMVAAMEHWKSRKEAGILRQRLSHGFQLQRVGQCRVIRELGRGGMGVVFEARHEVLRRRVAVKLLPWRFGDVSQFRKRFEREAQTASRLRHPNIVRVLGFGEWDGFSYYVMPFIEGVGLDWIIERLRSESGIVYADEVAALRSQQTGEPEASGEPDASASGYTRAGAPPRLAPDSGRSLRRESWKQFARIGLQVADALRYAHQQGTVHRDIKPGNLLLDKDGRVWITDFGLAEPLDRDPKDEQTDLAGTLRYMAPERFEGKGDERCDIYALGMTLYELTTLQTAVDEPNRGALIETVTGTDPILPRTLNRNIPKETEAVITKAIARDPDSRYQTAGEMAGDLLRLLNDQPVRAKRPSHWRRVKSRYRRGRAERANGLQKGGTG